MLSYSCLSLGEKIHSTQISLIIAKCPCRTSFHILPQRCNGRRTISFLFGFFSLTLLCTVSYTPVVPRVSSWSRLDGNEPGTPRRVRSLSLLRVYVRLSVWQAMLRGIVCIYVSLFSRLAELLTSTVIVRLNREKNTVITMTLSLS